MLISAAFELYRRDVIQYENQSPKTEENHVIACKALINFTGDIAIEKLDFATVRNWKEYLSKGRSINTVRGYVIKLRVVLAYLKNNKIDALDPALVPVPKREDTIPDYIMPDQVSLLIASTGKSQPGYSTANRLRNKAMISLLYASGLRVSELVSLNRRDLETDEFTVIGKGRKPRLCFIDARTRMLLYNYLRTRRDVNPALFLSDQTDERVSVSTVQIVFKNAWQKAGLSRPIHPHTMRHSFATNLMQNGMHIYGVSRLMGHASIQTTAMYLHITDPILKLDYNQAHTT